MIYLRFTDEATAKQCCPEWLDSHGNWLEPSPYLEFKVHGELFRPAKIDSEGNIIVPAVKKDGFFIDFIRGKLPQAAKKFIVTPKNPMFTLA